MSAPAGVAVCQQALEGVGSGVAASLHAVDCAVEVVGSPPPVRVPRWSVACLA